MRVDSLSRSSFANDIRPDQTPVDQHSAYPPSASNDIRADLACVSLVSSLCAALRDSCASLRLSSSTAPMKNVAARTARAADNAPPSAPAATAPPIGDRSEPAPPPYEAAVADLRNPPNYDQAPQVPAYYLDRPGTPGIMLFRADLPHGSPPLRLDELRPGMSLHVWDGKKWDTASVGQMKVAVGDQIRTIDQTNSHLLGPAA